MNETELNKLIQKTTNKVSVPTRHQDKINPQDTLERAHTLLSMVFDAKLHLFIESKVDETYFMNELARALVDIFPRKKRRSKDFIDAKRKMMDEKYSEGGDWHYKKKEIQLLWEADPKQLDLYIKRHPNAPVNDEQLKAKSDAKKAKASKAKLKDKKAKKESD